jgi:hypothetical protein
MSCVWYNGYYVQICTDSFMIISFEALLSTTKLINVSNNKHVFI